jgi:hypothetical protein
MTYLTSKPFFPKIRRALLQHAPMSAQDDSKIKGAASGGSNASAAVVVPCFPLNLYARRRAAAAAKTVKSASSRVAEDEEDDDEVEVEEEEEEERVGVRTRKQQQLAAKKKKERDDVLFSTRRLGVEQLLKEKPLSETQPYRCGKTYLDTRNYEIDMVEQSMHGEKLYKVFESSLKRASDKSFSLLFHGTGCKATEDIMQNGMNPKLRVSSSGDWCVLYTLLLSFLLLLLLLVTNIITLFSLFLLFIYTGLRRILITP